MWSVVLMAGFCIYYKVWNIKPRETDELDANLKTEKLNKNQWITIGSVGVMVVMVVALGFEIGLASFFIASILSILGIADEKSSLKKVPWGTLILICGVGVLMNVVIALGGIDLISEALLAVMTPATAAPIIAIASSLLSFFSSTTGVVMPSMIPTLGPIVETLGTGVSGFAELTSVVVTSSLSAAFSPASTGGGLILAAYMTASDSPQKEQEQNKLFAQLLVIAAACVVFNVLLSGIGFYAIIA